MTTGKKMITSWASKAWEDYLCWQRVDKKTRERVSDLIKEIKRTPFEGRGDPEPLKHGWSGYWSRRINLEHRLVYKVTEDVVVIVQCRYHY